MKSSRRSTRRPEIANRRGADLTGLSILITRERKQALVMAGMVTARGGDPLVFPTIQTRLALPPGQVEAFRKELSRSSWVVLSSVTGAKFLMDILGESFLPLLETRKVAAVGRKTASFLEESGCRVHLVPDKEDSRSLAEALCGILGDDDRVFSPRAKEGRRDLIDILKERGFRHVTPVLYETGVPEYGADEVQRVLDAGVSYATFTSPSTFQNFISLAGKESSASFFKNVKIAVIGDTTADCVAMQGFVVSVKPDYPDVERLLDAISAHNAGVR